MPKLLVCQTKNIYNICLGKEIKVKLLSKPVNIFDVANFEFAYKNNIRFVMCLKWRSFFRFKLE